MLREFASLMTAIIIAGRSGSAYAAQIGTMVVNDEIDAMRTLAVDPLDLLVWRWTRAHLQPTAACSNCAPKPCLDWPG